MKDPKRFERQKEAKVLLKEAEALRRTEKAEAEEQADGKGGVGKRTGL